MHSIPPIVSRRGRYRARRRPQARGHFRFRMGHHGRLSATHPIRTLGSIWKHAPRSCSTGSLTASSHTFARLAFDSRPAAWGGSASPRKQEGGAALRDGLAGRESLSAARRGEIEMARSAGKFTVSQARDIPFTPPGAGPNSCDLEHHPRALHRLEKIRRSAAIKRSWPIFYVRSKMSPPWRNRMLWRPSSNTSVAGLRAHRQPRSLFRLGA